MPLNLSAETEIVPGREHIEVQQSGDAVQGKQLAWQVGITRRGIQLPYIAPCGRVRDIQVFGKHTFVGLDPQVCLAVVIPHFPLAGVPVGIDFCAASDVCAVSIERIAQFSLDFILLGCQVIIFRNHRHAVYREIGGGTSIV